MPARFFRFISLGVILTMLIASFTTNVGAVLAKRPPLPTLNDPVLDVLPPWAQPPSPVSPAGTAPSAQRTESFTTNTVPSRNVEVNSIAGSTVTGSDCYQPGDTATLCFTAHNASPDLEWLDAVTLTFPAAWTVACNSQDTTDSGGHTVAFTCTAAGNKASYTDTDGSFGEIYDGEQWGFCADVTVPASASGTQSVDWVLSGDDNEDPPHDVNGTLDIARCLPLDLTPDTLEVQGCVAVTQTHTLNLFNNTGTSGTFNLTYDTPSGHGSISGPSSHTLNAGDTVTFTVTLTPDLCIMPGVQVIATIEASGNGYSDTSVITKTVSTVTSPEWQPATPTPQGTRYHAVAYHDGYLYQIGGETGRWTTTDAVNQYDVANDTWATATSMITGAYGIDAVAIGSNIYVPGGSDDIDDTGDGGTFLDALQVYSTTASGWSLAAPMPVALAYASAVAYEGRLYVIGGELNDGSYTNTLHIYDPATDTWSRGASMNETRGYAAAAAIGGKIYVAGGFAGGTTVRNSLEVYDPVADSWSFGPDLPKDWAPFGDGVLSDRYFVVFNGDTISHNAGGGTTYTFSRDACYFDTVTNKWHALPDLNRRLYGSQGDGDGTNLYLVSGRTDEGGWYNMATEVEHLEACPVCEEQGWLDGHVMDSELDDTEPTCTSAIVHIEPGSLNVPADRATGYYGPVQLISGTYTLKASASCFSAETADVTITTGVTTTKDFNLRRPMIEVTPTDFISITAVISKPVTYPLVISNSGHLPLDFDVRDMPSPLPPKVLSKPQSNPSIKVEPGLLAQLDASETAGYMIYFRKQTDLSPALQMGWHERGWFVMNALQAAAERSQAKVRAYLDAQAADYQAFWIDNVIVVNSSGRNTFNGLMNFPEIATLRAHRIMHVIEPVQEDNPGNSVPMSIEPNISHVGADQVWERGFTGAGMVVANIDTGVRYTHDALVNQYRGNQGSGSYNHDYNWLDADTSHTTPFDDHGHGTHTMGTMVGNDGGTNRIGMAPGAQWIACDACDANGDCTGAALLTCAQWIAAPYPIGDPASPDPDMRPHVVNNSWGDCEQFYDDWYQGVVDSWYAAGIYPVFSNGNSTNCGYSTPPGCNTVGNPARYGNVTGVGSTGQSDGQYATHSNWGPTDNLDAVNPRGYPDLKPQVVAPGVNIRSSLNEGDSAYASLSGTSMSAPHVTAMIALMWQAAPCLVGDYATTETLIEQTATPIPYTTSCGGEGPGNMPNYATGWGEINASAAVQAATDRCDLPWVWENPITGTIPGPGMIEIDITFHCTETKDYTGTLRIFHNAPCTDSIDVPIVLQCQEPPPIYLPVVMRNH